MTKTTQKNTIYNIVAVLVGALLMGFLWRVRGDTGWGSSWGLLNAGFVYCLFITLAAGERKKLDMGWLAMTAFSFMLTVPAWGTIISQISGLLFRPAEGEAPVYVSVWSAVVLMLSLGFGVATIFGIMLGRGYSDKQWKIKDIVILIAVFYIADLAAKASVSHLIFGIIQPEAVEYFKNGLAEAGIDGSIYEVYMQHFDNVSWGKKITGGRNYFSTIQVISSVFRTVAALIATRFVIKDKVAAKTGAVVSGAFAFAITISDLFFYLGNGGYHMEGQSAFSDMVYPWSCWEYFTGFIAGGIITAFILAMKKKENVSELAFAKVPEKAAEILKFTLGFVALIGISIVRPVLERFGDSSYQLIATIIAVVIALAFVAILNSKLGFNCKKVSMTALSGILLSVFAVYIFIVYVAVGPKEEVNLYSMGSLHNILCTVSAALVFVWAVYNTVKNKKTLSGKE